MTPPPGPRAPGGLQSLCHGADPFGFLGSAHRRHGDVLTVRARASPSGRSGRVVVLARSHGPARGTGRRGIVLVPARGGRVVLASR